MLTFQHGETNLVFDANASHHTVPVARNIVHVITLVFNPISYNILGRLVGSPLGLQLFSRLFCESYELVGFNTVKSSWELEWLGRPNVTIPHGCYK
jgi:hypothetical protein